VKTIKKIVWVDEAEELGYFKTMVLVMEEMQGWWKSQRIVSKKRFGGQC